MLDKAWAERDRQLRAEFSWGRRRGMDRLKAAWSQVWVHVVLVALAAGSVIALALAKR